MSEFTLKDFRGVIPAALSIFDENENLDLEATKEFTEFLLKFDIGGLCLLYTSPSPRDATLSRMPSSA